MGKRVKQPTKNLPQTRLTAGNTQVAGGTQNLTIEGYSGMNSNKCQHLFKTQLSILFRGNIYSQFGLNKYEVITLLILSGLLENKKQQVISRNIFFGFLGGTIGQKAKFGGYMDGLLKKGMLGSYEFIGFPDSVSYGITDLGHEVMRYFFAQQNDLFARFNRIEECKILPITIGVDIPKYKARQSA